MWVKSLIITHLDYITLEKQLQQDKQQQIHYQQSQVENFEEQLDFLQEIQDARREMNKFQQKQLQQLQKQELLIHKKIQNHRAKNPKPCK